MLPVSLQLSCRGDVIAFMAGLLAPQAETSVSAGTLKPDYHTMSATATIFEWSALSDKNPDSPQDRDESCMDYQSGWGRVAGGIIAI